MLPCKFMYKLRTHIMDLRKVLLVQQTTVKQITTAEEDVDRRLRFNRILDTKIDEVLSRYNRAVAARMETFIAPLLTRLEAFRAAKHTNLQHLDNTSDKVRELCALLRRLDAHLRRLN